MGSDNVVVGLDIGTTKIGAVIAELSEDGEPKVVGVGTSVSEGLRRGVVVNLEKTVKSISKAVADAELMAGIEARSVLAGIAGDHIRSINSRGVIAVSGANREITKSDVGRVVDAAKAVAIPMDREIIHVLAQEYIVDDQPGIKDPVGMAGVRLEAEVHIVTGAVTSAQNIYKSIQRAGMGVKDLVLEPLASSYAVLSPEEKELGVMLLDVGGGTTDVAVFFEGSIRHTAVIGLGGNNVTGDIAIGLRTSISQAEKIKVEKGCALASIVQEDEMITVPGIGGRQDRQVPRSLLTSIIQPRMEEIFSLCLRELRRTDYADVLAAGVVITGGASVMPGVPELAEQVFDMPVKLGIPAGFGGLVDLAQKPMHATGVGLVLFSMQGEEGNGLGRLTEANMFEKIFERMKRWFGEFF
jgi:cell division protein FtsA